MLSAEKLQRLNQLAKQAKERTLTDAEAAEQNQLREEYLKNFRSAMRNHLDNIEVVDAETNTILHRRK